MTISPEQIKAARALLGWSQEDLAKASNLGISTICSLEKGNLSPRSAGDVRKTFENSGLEFFENDGLGRRKDEIKVYRGFDACEKFYYDLLQTLKEKGGDVAVVSKSPDMLARSLGVTARANYERLGHLSDLATFKCVLSEVHDSSLCLSSFQLRAISKYQASCSSFFIYGNKYATIVSEGSGTFTYVVVASLSLSQSGWQEFMPLWTHAMPLVIQPQLQDRRIRA